MRLTDYIFNFLGAESARKRCRHNNPLPFVSINKNYIKPAQFNQVFITLYKLALK